MGGLAERMLIFEDDPFPDVAVAGIGSLSSRNKSATNGNCKQPQEEKQKLHLLYFVSILPKYSIPSSKK